MISFRESSDIEMNKMIVIPISNKFRLAYNSSEYDANLYIEYNGGDGWKLSNVLYFTNGGLSLNDFKDAINRIEKLLILK